MQLHLLGLLVVFVIYGQPAVCMVRGIQWRLRVRPCKDGDVKRACGARWLVDALCQPQELLPSNERDRTEQWTSCIRRPGRGRMLSANRSCALLLAARRSP